MITLVLLLTSLFCIFVIYNAFNISLNEKKKYFGMLRSLGATKKHIRVAVKYEARILSVFSIPLGVLISISTVKLVLIILNKMLVESLVMPLKIMFNPIYIIMSLIFIVFTIMYSSSIAGDDASTITPVSLIRQNSDIHVKKIKDHKLIKRLFGSSGELAYKNMKRNKHKYKITVSILVISFVLFITFGTFTNYLVINWDLNLTPNYDAKIFFPNEELEESMLKRILTIDEIDESILIKDTFIQYKVLNKSSYTDDYNKYNEENKDYSFITIYTIDENSYNEYLDKLSIKDKDAVFIYNKDIYQKPLYKPHNEDQSRYKEISYSVFKDKKVDIELCNVVYNNDTIANANCALTFNNVHVTEVPFYKGQDRIGILVSPKIFKELYKKLEEIEENTWESKTLYINSKDYIGLDNKILDLLSQYPSSDYSYEAITLNNQSEYSKLKAIRLVLYSIVWFITLSGIVSVFTIISTNMALRQREFAMLKSIGLSKKKFNKMIRLESVFLGIKTLFYGIIISLLVYVIWIGLYYLMTKEIIIDFPYNYYIVGTIVIVFIIFIIMYYSSSKLKNKNIIESIKQESV